MRQLGFFSALLFVCAGLSCSTQNKQAATGVLEGNIFNVTGNQMPGPGHKPSPGKGVVRSIWIYPPTTAKEAGGTGPLFSGLRSKELAHAQSDATGHYKVRLPAGRYSLFIMEDNGLFASETDGAGILNPVEVVAGKTTTKNFTITLNAFY